MLRRVLLAASDSARMRQLVTSAPLARGVVARYVAGNEAADAVAVAGRLRADGLLISLDHLGEDTHDARQADLATQEYTTLLASLASAGLSGGGAAEVSVSPPARRPLPASRFFSRGAMLVPGRRVRSTGASPSRGETAPASARPAGW